MGDNTIGSYEEMPVSEEHTSMSDEVNINLSRKLIVKTSPQVNMGCQYLVSYGYGQLVE